MKKCFSTLKLSKLFVLACCSFLLLASWQNVIAQCPSPCGPNAFNEGGTVTPISNAWQNVSVGSGTYIFSNVHNGGTYSYSHCNTSNANLTDLQISGTTGSSCIFYNDNNGPHCAGALSSASWLSVYNGIINVNTNKANCQGAGSSTSGGTFTVTISGSGFMDETSWTLRDASNNIIASGGPYATGTYVVNATTTNVPLTFFIETQGSFNDNVINYSVVCSGSTLLSGTIGGGQAFTQGGLTCGGTFSSFGSAVLSYRCDGPGNPATFGNGEWRLYAWNAGDASGGSGAWSTGYSGYLTSPNLSFNTTSFWTSGGSPSDYVGFLGCHVAADAHSWSAKRQNFPCAVYNISIPNHDDAYQLFINGVLRSSHTAGCCDDHGVVWTGVLNSSSTVEFRVSEGGGGSEAQIVLTPVITAALNGGGLSGNQTICTGGDPTVLTGTAATGGAGPAYENGSYTYEWIQQDNCTGGGLAIGGTNAVNYDPPTGLTTTRCYYRTVIDACGNDKSVGPVTVTVVADPTITAPTFTNGSICPGGSTTMNVTTPNPGTGTPTYTWQYFNGSTWVSAANGVPAGSVYSGLGTTTVGVSGITGIATHQYRVVYSTTGSGCGSVTSGTGQLVVFSEPAVSAPSLTNTTICAGGSSDATVTASSGTGAYGYQWQYFDGASWINVTSGVPTGAAYVNPNGATMSISGITAPGAYQYRNRVTAAGSGCDPVTSTAVTLTVNPDPVATAPTLTNATVCVGGSSTISSTVSGGVTLGYQWQYFNGGAWSNVVANTPAGATYSGATTTSLTVSGVTATGSHSYRLFVTSSGSDCGSTASTAGVLNVVTGPAVTAPSFTNSPICVGGSSSAGVTASSGSGTYSYVWQYNNGGTWANVTNATPAGSVYSNQTTATLGVAGITATGSYQYRSIVSASGSGCVPAVSSTATLTVVADPTVSAATLTNTTDRKSVV